MDQEIDVTFASDIEWTEEGYGNIVKTVRRQTDTLPRQTRIEILIWLVIAILIKIGALIIQTHPNLDKKAK